VHADHRSIPPHHNVQRNNPFQIALRASAGYVGSTRWTSNFSITSAGTRASGFAADANSEFFNPDSNSAQPRFQRHQNTATANAARTRTIVHPIPNRFFLGRAPLLEVFLFPPLASTIFVALVTVGLALSSVSGFASLVHFRMASR